MGRLYEANKRALRALFDSCAFTINGLKEGDAIQKKFDHIYNVAELMEKAGKIERLTDMELSMAYAAGLFHDIACINDVSLTGREYGPKHGERGAMITYGLLRRELPLVFSLDELETISIVIENHDGAETAALRPGSRTARLTSLLRDCDKIDCFRRLATEPLETLYQRPLDYQSTVRAEFADRCIAGAPIKYAEMENFNEESLLYLGWIFQLKNKSCRWAAMPQFEALANRILDLTEDAITASYIRVCLKKARKCMPGKGAK